MPSVDTLLDSRSGPHYGETDCTVLEKARAEIVLLRMIWEIMHIWNNATEFFFMLKFRKRARRLHTQKNVETYSISVTRTVWCPRTFSLDTTNNCEKDYNSTWSMQGIGCSHHVPSQCWKHPQKDPYCCPHGDHTCCWLYHDQDGCCATDDQCKNGGWCQSDNTCWCMEGWCGYYCTEKSNQVCENWAFLPIQWYFFKNLI